MSNPIKFGTDGWRAVIAEDFTFDNVRVCAQAVADYLKQAGLAERGLVIGYDNRFASEHFAAACAEVVAANGIKAWLCSKVAPTPVVSYGTMTRKAGGAIIITASHNAAIWNGFKIKTPDGAGAPDEVTAAVEKNISRILTTGKIERLPLTEALKQGSVEYLDLDSIYTSQLARLVDLPSLRKAKLKVIVDSMYGAGSGYLKTLLDGGDIEVVEINGERNPIFPGIRPEPITANLAKLSATVRRRKAAVGIATDGDADRVGIMDEKGRFVTQLQVFALLALYLLEVRGERGAIVKTITATSMLYRLGEIFKVPVRETSVGFKFVAPLMMKENALIGGEESGGFGFRGHAPERDGILAALYFLDLMVKTGKTPSQLIDYLYSKVGTHHYERIDIEFHEAERTAIVSRVKQPVLSEAEGNRPGEIAGIKVLGLDTGDGFRFRLADNSWLLIRFSGTEPLLRIYAESASPAGVKKLLEAGKALAGV
ncbi:MAG: phosphoglucomutase/phosphomannomutase family protein [Chloroflexota bacterium]